MTIAEIDSILNDAVEENAPGAAVGVIHQGEVIHVSGYGLANLEWDAPITTQTVFRWASITKPLTAIAIMLLAERGDLSLDDPITRFLPDYPTSGHHLTVYHLLTHTSGINNQRGEGGLYQRYDLNAPRMMAHFSQRPFYFRPGTAYRYSNTGYILLGLIIEQISGMSYADFMRSQVFAPLGMESATFFDHRGVIPRRATGYIQRDGVYAHSRFFSADISYAGGGLGGSVQDVICWLQAMREQVLLSPDGWMQMITPGLLEDGTPIHYGLGWAIKDYHDHKVIGHSGTTPGFTNQLVVFPDDDLAVIVLSNNAQFDSDHIAATITRHLLQIEPAKHRPYILGAEALAKCIGTYRVADYTLKLLREDGNLILRTSKDRRILAASRTSFFSADNPDVLITFSDEMGDKYRCVTLQTSFSTYVAHRVEP